MPMIVDKLTVGKEFDRRRKLTDEQKEEIKKKYETGFYSKRGLAREYGVDKKTIQLILDQEVKRRNDERIKEHWHDYKSTKEDRNLAMRKHRRYKKELHKDGKI